MDEEKAAAEGSIIYYRKKNKTMLMEVCAVGFVALGLWLILGDLDGKGGLVARAAGVISILCFGLTAIVLGRQVVKRHPVYAINHDGFTLGTPGDKKALFVDWNEVQGIGVANIGDDKVLSFAFREPKDIIERLPRKQKKKAQENEAAGVPILMVPQNLLSTSVDEIRNVSTRFFFAAG